MTINAIKGYLASLKKHKEPIPTDGEIFLTSLEIKRIPVHA
jgi:hypothetical protein